MKRLDSGFRRNDVRGSYTRAEGLKLMALGPNPVLLPAYTGYYVDPLTCPKCSRKMKVISVIEDEDVIKVTGPQKTPEYSIDYSVSRFYLPHL